MVTHVPLMLVMLKRDVSLLQKIVLELTCVIPDLATRQPENVLSLQFNVTITTNVPLMYVTRTAENANTLISTVMTTTHVHTSKVCNDNNACTKDSCNVKTGECLFEDITAQIVAQNTNKCLNAKCDPVKGLVTSDITCESTDKCSKSFCDPTRGCVSQPIVCEAPAHCGAPYQCNPTSGVCEIVRPSCDDNNSCTVDSYVDGVGCQNLPKCQSNNLCVVPSCDKTNGACQFTDKNCDDGNACTVDSCNPTTGQCVNTLKSCSCSAGNTGSCNASTGQCEFYPSCRSNSDCTNGGNCDPSKGCIVERD